LSGAKVSRDPQYLLRDLQISDLKIIDRSIYLFLSRTFPYIYHHRLCVFIIANYETNSVPYVSLLLFPWSAFPGLLSLGLAPLACLTCLSAWVVFRWQWCEETSTHPAGNHHMTGQKAWPSNWLLFLTFRAQMGLR